MGVVVSVVIMSIVVGAVATDGLNAQQRALSCMANGNTVAQCQTVLGLPSTQK